MHLFDEGLPGQMPLLESFSRQRLEPYLHPSIQVLSSLLASLKPSSQRADRMEFWRMFLEILWAHVLAQLQGRLQGRLRNIIQLCVWRQNGFGEPLSQSLPHVRMVTVTQGNLAKPPMFKTKIEKKETMKGPGRIVVKEVKKDNPREASRRKERATSAPRSRSGKPTFTGFHKRRIFCGFDLDSKAKLPIHFLYLFTSPFWCRLNRVSQKSVLMYSQFSSSLLA